MKSKNIIAAAERGHRVCARGALATALILSALSPFLVILSETPAGAWSAAGSPEALEYTRIPNGIARASSSGDNRLPAHAFDRLWATFWRNRTQQTGIQYLEMDFNGRRYTVRRISLAFGEHYPSDYRFRVRRNGVWGWSKGITGNTLGSRAHVWQVPLQNVEAVRIYCLRYSRDDYFSVREMVIEK